MRCALLFQLHASPCSPLLAAPQFVISTTDLAKRSKQRRTWYTLNFSKWPRGVAGSWNGWIKVRNWSYKMERKYAQLEGWRRYRHLVHVLILVYVPAHHNLRNLPTTHSSICSQCNHSLQLLVWVLMRTHHGVIKLIESPSTHRLCLRLPKCLPSDLQSSE